MYRITGQTQWLRDAYAAFIAVLGNVDRNGGIFPCYTPDMIPGTPPYPFQGRELDLRRTTTRLAMGWPDSYSSSGTYVLIRAADCWDAISGIVVEDRTTINGHFDDEGIFISAAPQFDRLALSCVPDRPLAIRTTPGQDVTVTFDAKNGAVKVRGGQVVREDDRTLTCRAEGILLSIGADGAE